MNWFLKTKKADDRPGAYLTPDAVVGFSFYFLSFFITGK